MAHHAMICHRLQREELLGNGDGAAGIPVESGLYPGGNTLATYTLLSILGNDEVDFVLKKNQKFIAIEVKSNGESHTTGLERFHQLYHPVASFIVGERGIKPEVFLSMNLLKLFE